jgi:hypothetical protein
MRSHPPTAAGPAVSGLGADSREVLSGLLGLTDQQIKALQQQGVLARLIRPICGIRHRRQCAGRSCRMRRPRAENTPA